MMLMTSVTSNAGETFDVVCCASNNKRASPKGEYRKLQQHLAGHVNQKKKVTYLNEGMF